MNHSSVYLKAEAEYEEGKRFLGTPPRSLIGGLAGAGKTNTRKHDEGYGAVRAIDPMTGDRKWEFKMNDVTDAGILTTASHECLQQEVGEPLGSSRALVLLV